MTRSDSCVLCGNDVATEVRMAILEWREPIGKEIWAHVPRCTDVAACRARVENVLREPWPVKDGTPPSVLLPEPDPEAEHPPAAPVDEEVEIPWLR